MNVPNHWLVVALHTVADIQTGLAKGKLGLKNPIQMPYLRVANVQDGYFDLREIKLISVEAAQTERFSLKNGDVLLTEGGDADKLGRGSIWREQIKNCLHQNHIFVVRPRNNYLISEFLNYLTSSYYGKAYFLSCSKQSTNLASINSTQIKEFPVLLPPLLEQVKIAEILSSWDDALENLGALLEAKRKLKRGLMQQLLTGRVRFKEFEARGEAWEVATLEEIAVVTMGSSPKSEGYNSDGIGLPLLQGNADIKNRFSAPRVWTKDITKECLPDDLLLSVRAPVGEIARSRHHACIGRGIASLRARNFLNQDYLYQVMVWSEPQWATYSQGSTFEAVNSKDIKEFSVTLPSTLEEQRKIALVLSTLDQEISTLEREKTALETQKRGLMQLLLTGKVRVNVIDTSSPPFPETAMPPLDASSDLLALQSAD